MQIQENFLQMNGVTVINGGSWDPITDFTAHGIFNQFIYVDPESNVVIAKTSSNHRFRSEEIPKAAHIAMFRSITKHIENTFN